MKRYILILSAYFLLFCILAKAQEEKVIVIVNSLVYSDLKSEIFRYVDDISSEYRIDLYETTGGTPQDLKNFIKSQSDSLVGCLLIGSMPVCWFEIENDLAADRPTTFPCDLFFMDLDGSWSDDDNDGIYDNHTNATGDVAPEIFIGRIDASLFSTNIEHQVEDLRKYFNRDHNYWTGAYNFRKTGLTYTDVDWKDYAPINEEMVYLYGINNYQLIKDERIGRKDYLENRLNNDQYEFIQIAAHSTHDVHHFNFKGGISPDDIRNAAPKALGYNLFACSACDYTQSNFLGGAYIFNDSKKSLVVIGSTKIGAMLQFYAFYQPLGANKPVGKAYKDWFDYLAPYDDGEKSWHYGMTILGDPLIKFNSGNTNHGPLVDIGCNQRILWPDSIVDINANVKDDGLPEGSQLTHSWEEVSGPGDVSFDDKNYLSTSIRLDTLGDYRIKLTATDGEYISEDFKNIKVSQIKWKGETNPISGREMGIIVHDSLVYLSTNYNFNIINAVNKTNPRVIGSYEFQNLVLVDPYFNNVDIDSNYAYVVLSEYGLHIININDCYNPYEVGTFRTHDTLEKANAVRVIGDYVYVADNVRGLMILDVHDRTSPKLIGHCPTDGTALGISVQGNYGYIADGSNGLRIIDISDKAHPKETGFFNLNCSESYLREVIQVLGNYAYVYYNDNNRGYCISIIDISDKADPFEVSHLEGLFKGLYVEGNYLYCLSQPDYDSNIFSIYDISDKSNPRHIESYKMENIYFQDLMNIYKYGQYVYILDNLLMRGLNIFQVHLDNTRPYAYAGEDKIICNNRISLEGMASDDRLPVESSLSFYWEKIAGPGDVHIINPNDLNTQVVFSNSGSYVLRLSVNDGKLTGYDDIRIISVSEPLVSTDVEVCEGYSVPDLTASGDSIRWYSDAQLIDLLHSGNVFATGQTSPGSYLYYVTQSNSNCESQPDTVALTIKSVPGAPLPSNLEICEGDMNQSLFAHGENIRWYGDSTLSELLHAGSSLVPGQTEPGTYRYYITQTIVGCESEYSMVNLSINPLPDIILEEDTTISQNQHITFGPFNNSYFYLWNDGSVSPYFEISGNEIGLGYHTISVIVTDTNTCKYSDTIIINVVPAANTNKIEINNTVIIFPNPANGLIHIKFSNFQPEDILIKLLNQKGEIIYSVNNYIDSTDKTLSFNISYLLPGIYYFEIITQTKQFLGKVIFE